MNKKEIIARLDAAKADHSGTRLQRLLKHPYLTLWPLVMRKTGRTKEMVVPTFWGGTFSAILPEAVSIQLWRRSYFDEPVCRTLIERLEPGCVFVDIGAHMGLFSLLGSALVGPKGKVIAIEAMPSTFERLTTNVIANRAHDNILLHQGAAFDKRQELEFSDYGIIASSLNTAFTSRGQKGFATNAKKVKVQAAPADEIIAGFDPGRVDLIKIDAESSEKFVIAGLQKTLTTYKPTIVMEVGDISSDQGSPTAELIDILARNGYRPYEWSGGTLRPFVSVGPLPYANLVFKAA